MGKVKTLIVDDSVVYRSQISAALQDLPWLEILRPASNGKIALERIKQNLPDLLILDLEMPEMDGLETLKELRRNGLNCKTIVFSSASKRGAEITLESLRLGACDFVAKPGALDNTESTSHLEPSERIRALLLPKIEAIFPDHAALLPEKKDGDLKNQYPQILWSLFRPEIIVIASSTGGPTVLEKIFSDLQSTIKCPVVIVQHMPPVFTSTFAERLGRLSGIEASEAKHGMTLESGKVYVAPGGYHLKLKGNRFQTEISLDQTPPIHSVRPAADPLFESAAEIFKEKCLAIVLTGMGYDGRDGAVAVKNSGGGVVIQNKESCAVFGMPRAVFSVGAFDKIATPLEITELIRNKAGLTTLDRKAQGKG